MGFAKCCRVLTAKNLRAISLPHITAKIRTNAPVETRIEHVAQYPDGWCRVLPVQERYYAYVSGSTCDLPRACPRASHISQREVRGGDDEILAAVRAALLEDPDVLVLEDIRTDSLMNAALEAALIWPSDHRWIGRLWPGRVRERAFRQRVHPLVRPIVHWDAQGPRYSVTSVHPGSRSRMTRPSSDRYATFGPARMTPANQAPQEIQPVSQVRPNSRRRSRMPPVGRERRWTARRRAARESPTS